MLNTITKWLKRYISQPEALALIAIIVIIGLAFLFVGDVLIPIILSIIIAYLLNGFVQYLTHWKIKRLLAVIIVYCLFLGAFVALVVLLFPMLMQQLSTLFIEAPKMLTSTQRFITNLAVTHPEVFSAAQLNFALSELTRYLADFGRFALDFSIASIGGAIAITLYIILIPLLVFFFLKDGKLVINWFDKLLPQPHKTIDKIAQILDTKMWAYIRGRIIEIIIMAIVSSIILIAMGINYAILLGVAIGLSVIVPYVGAVLVTIPVALIGFLQWGLNFHFMSLLVSYTVIMVLDANILVPLLFSGKMHLHPIAIIIAILIFGSLFGFWGVFFAIPLATLVDTLLRHWPQTND
jgi:putative permease